MTITKQVVQVKKGFDMNDVPSCKFQHSQWEPCTEGKHASISYLIYRILFMIILVSSITTSILCQSYLFEIFLTNWSLVLQTVYAVLFAFSTLWRMRGSLMMSRCMKSSHVYPESNTKAFELKETESSWEITATDTNSMIVNEDRKNGSASVINGNNHDINEDPSQQSLQSATTTTVLTTTDASALRKAETCVIINSNNNNNNTRRSNDDPPSHLEKLIWILLNISHVLPHFVSFGYWIFVYKYEQVFEPQVIKMDPDQPACDRFKSHFIVHSATSVLAFVDSLVVAVPVKKIHFVFPTCVLLLFGVFSYLYEIGGGPYREGKEYIYSTLNWRYKPLRTLLYVIVGVALSPFLHLITCWGVHRVKVCLASCYLRRKSKK